MRRDSTRARLFAALATALFAVACAATRAAAQVGEELKTTAGEFAGTYREGGEMRHSYLRWAPGGGFVYLYVYERHAVLDFSYGKVEVTPTALVFKIEREQRGIVMGFPPRLALRPTPRRWVAARWRTTNYLVPENKIEDFGKYVG